MGRYLSRNGADISTERHCISLAPMGEIVLWESKPEESVVVT